MAWPVLAAGPGDTANSLNIPTWRDIHIFENYIPPKQLNEFYSKDYIEDIIRLKSEKAGLNADLMARIAYCESGFQQIWNYKHSENPNYWTAFGVFQIVKGNEIKYGINRTTLDGNIDLAIRLYLDQGLKPWTASRGCILSTDNS